MIVRGIFISIVGVFLSKGVHKDKTDGIELNTELITLLNLVKETSGNFVNSHM